MNHKIYDPIVAEVRQNREAMLAEFGGDIEQLDAYLASKQSEREAVGAHYVTEEERLTRLAWNRQRREAEDRRVASLPVQ